MTTSATAIPILAGAKYYFAKGFYGMAQAGLHMVSIEVKTETVAGSATGTADESEFGFGAGAGYELQVGKMMLDVTAKYMQVASDFSYISARVGLKFGL